MMITQRGGWRHDRHTVGAVAVAIGIVLGGGVNGCTKRLPHGGEDPVYPLRGLHAAVACEGCHGEGTPKALPTVCIECHEADRKAQDHYPGENCAPCHTEYGWDQVETTLTRETGLPTPTGDTGPTITTPTTDPNHDGLGLTTSTLCWTCHETARSTLPTPTSPTHYYDETLARRGDCGPCHGMLSWTDQSPTGGGAPFEHQPRSPHGTFSDGVENASTGWVVACEACHTTPDVYTVWDCQTCHLPIFTPPGHYGLTEPSAENNLACTEVCHPGGE